MSNRRSPLPREDPQAASSDHIGDSLLRLTDHHAAGITGSPGGPRGRAGYLHKRAGGGGRRFGRWNVRYFELTDFGVFRWFRPTFREQVRLQRPRNLGRPVREFDLSNGALLSIQKLPPTFPWFYSTRAILTFKSGYVLEIRAEREPAIIDWVERFSWWVVGGDVGAPDGAVGGGGDHATCGPIEIDGVGLENGARGANGAPLYDASSVVDECEGVRGALVDKCDHDMRKIRVERTKRSCP